MHQNNLTKSQSKELKELICRYKKIFIDYEGVDVFDVNQLGHGEDSLLHFAAFHSGYKDVEVLLHAGARVNAKGDIGLTALHHAASKNKADVVELLLAHGADKKIKNEFGQTALDWAKCAKAKDVYRLLK